MSEIFDIQFWAFVGVIAGIYAILALGIQLQFGFTGILNFGQVAFMAIGAYAMAILVVSSGLPLWLAATAGVVVAMAFGALLALPTVRLRAEYFAIVTIAFSEITRFVAINEDGLTGGPVGTVGLQGPGEAASFNAEWQRFAGSLEDALESVIGSVASKDVTMLVIVWAVVLVLAALVQFAVHSPWGRTLRAIRDDEDAAAALGKDVLLRRIQVLVLGSGLAAIAGLLFAFQTSFFSPDDFDPLTTFFAWTIVILGGAGRIWAVPVGALLFGVIFAGTRFFDFFPFSLFDSAERAFLRLIIVGAILIGLMVFRPQGIFGRRREMVLD